MASPPLELDTLHFANQADGHDGIRMDWVSQSNPKKGDCIGFFLMRAVARGAKHWIWDGREEETSDRHLLYEQVMCTYGLTQLRDALCTPFTL